MRKVTAGLESEIGKVFCQLFVVLVLLKLLWVTLK